MAFYNLQPRFIVLDVLKRSPAELWRSHPPTRVEPDATKRRAQKAAFVKRMSAGPNPTLYCVVRYADRALDEGVED